MLPCGEMAANLCSLFVYFRPVGLQCDDSGELIQRQVSIFDVLASAVESNSSYRCLFFLNFLKSEVSHFLGLQMIYFAVNNERM